MSTKKQNYSFISIAFILLVFGIIFIPRIIDRIKGGDVTRDHNRSADVSTQKIETSKIKRHIKNKQGVLFLEHAF